VQQLQRWLRMPRCIDVSDAGIVDMSVWSIQRVWRDGVQQLQRWLHLSHARRHE
jgi:hypothetical protein